MYWFDDERAERPGQCRTPASWRVMYRAAGGGGEWKEVAGASGYGVAKDRFNEVTFQAVEAGAVRVEVKLREGVSAGVLEWRVE